MYHILLYDIKKEMYQESEGNERCVKLERDVLVELFTRQTAMIISAKRVETRDGTRKFTFNYRDILTNTHEEKKKERKKLALKFSWKHLTGS